MNEFDAEIVARASAAAAGRWPGARVGAVTPLPGGVSSLTFRSALHRPDTVDLPIVIKVAPPGLAPIRNRDVLRQARIIDLLDTESDLVMPTVLFTDTGNPTDHAVPPLFGMTLVPGESYEPLLDVSPVPPTADVVSARAHAAATMLATMHASTPAALGIEAEPVIGVGAELERWRTLFTTIDDDICPGHGLLHARLEASIPRPIEPRVVHGDYRLANMLFDGPRASAVIDWEIWSVGDPRSDLAWLLMHTAPAHRFHTERPPADRAAGDGMPSFESVSDSYLSGGGNWAGVANIEWFVASCLYKTASTISVLVKRNRRRSDPDPTLVVAATSLPDVLERGHHFMDIAESVTSR